MDPPNRPRRWLNRRWAARGSAVIAVLLQAVRHVERLGATERARRKFRRIGVNVSLPATQMVADYEQISVGDRSSFGTGMHIWGELIVGNDVMFGPDVYTMHGYHRTDIVGLTMRESGGDARRPVVVEDDVWIGARSALMKGVRVGEGTAVGTASMVLDDLPPYVIAVGAPCRPIRRRFSNEELRVHLARRGAPPERIEEIIRVRDEALGPIGI